MSEYEMARIDQHETRIQAMERKLDDIESKMSSVRLMLMLIMAEVPVGMVML